MAHAMFRPRRLREKPLLRKLIRETVLAVDDLIYPLFIVHGRGVREPIGSMPGQFRLSIDELVKDMKDVASMGIPGVLLFGLPAEKDPRGSEAYAEDGIVQQAVRAVKDVVPDLLVATDGSKLSDKAVAHAIALAQAIKATLTAFYAAPDYPMPAYADGVG